MIIFTDNYRRNLILYWRQFSPQWDIPKGFHVHHIRPKSTFDDENDPRIHHPKNLIALHPDDHATIHKMRGDQWSANFIKIKGASEDRRRKRLTISCKGRVPWNKGIPAPQCGAPNIGRKATIDQRKNMSASCKGRKGPTISPDGIERLRKARTGKVMLTETKQKIREANIGKKASIETRQKMSKSHCGFVHSKESIQKMRDKAGHSQSTETKQKLREANIGKKIFNNGSINKSYHPGTEPEGFRLGRIRRIR